MTHSGIKILSCPNCGCRVSGLESACPRCGAAFNDDSRFECPFCGTLVPATADSCPSCQVDYQEFSEKVEKDVVDRAMDKILEDIDALIESDEEEPACPECGAPLKSPGEKCPSCSAAADDGSQPPPGSPVEPTKPEEHTDSLCPICGTWVKSYESSCPECGAEFIDDEEEDSEQGDVAYCPVCNKPASIDVAVCPHCGVEFEDEEEETPIMEAGAPIPKKSPPAQGPKVVVRPKTVIKKTIARDQGDEITTERLGRKIPERRGLSNGTGVINGKGWVNGRHLTSERGEVNGRGRVNGRHFTNGSGAVNGRELVNGTGFTNGREQGGRFLSRQRLVKRMSWQLLAVLVAILIVVPTFVYLSHLRSQSPYSVDGDFGDWDDSRTFSAMTESTDPAINIVEWAADSHNSGVYMYARMEQDLMAGNRAERLVLFIDADGSTESGYVLKGVGADYMFDMLGWNGSVRSTTVSEYRAVDDQLDWNSWRLIGSARCHVVATEIEAMAELPVRLNESARLVLMTQNEDAACCISYAVPLNKGLLIVEQMPVPEVALTDTLIRDPEASLLRLRFTGQGEGGVVNQVTPTLAGISSYSAIPEISLEEGETRVVDLRVDSSYLMSGQFVSAKVTEDGISSSFRHVQVVGYGASAYCESPPSGISIDGAFGDWAGKTVKDADDLPVDNLNVNIDEVGAESSAMDSFFYLSVYGELCAGTSIPKACAIPSGGGGGSVVTERKSGEDYVKIFIDSDRSADTGEVVSLGTMTIGADYVIDISGACCEIETASVSAYTATAWVALGLQIDVAKGEKRMEIGISSSGIGSPADLDFIVEMTDWKGSADLASNITLSGMKGWIVDSDTTTSEATSMSYQRKLFHDGTNYWSIFSDGSDTLCKYSSDGGETWTLNGQDDGQVFSNAGVVDASLWYDASNQKVYAVGDRSTTSTNVYIQMGTVNPTSHSITWDSSDTTQSVSTGNLGGKNTFICRDADGHLWILSSQMSQTGPARYNLAAYRSDSAGSISAWTFSSNMLTTDSSNPDLKGSILPAGTGGDVWAVYHRDSYVDARKCASGSWGSVENVYTGSGTTAFMNVAPASAVVDGDGDLHVVYGDSTRESGADTPQIQYKCRSTSGWSSATHLDDDGASIPHSYPTISLDSSTGYLYALWLRADNYNIACKKNDGGSWSAISLSGQTTYEKQYLTSVYSASAETYICWQWTQNTTSDVEVLFDSIPEFEEIVVPVLLMLAIFFIVRGRRSRRSHGL